MPKYRGILFSPHFAVSIRGIAHLCCPPPSATTSSSPLSVAAATVPVCLSAHSRLRAGSNIFPRKSTYVATSRRCIKWAPDGVRQFGSNAEASKSTSA